MRIRRFVFFSLALLLCSCSPIRAGGIDQDPGGTTQPQAATATPPWEQRNIELYNLQLSLPAGWSLEESNRRPAPTPSVIGVEVHDCADYVLNSPDGMTILTLKPVCGSNINTPGDVPPDAVVIRELDPARQVVRYYDAAQSVYFYTEVYTLSVAGQEPARGAMQPPVLAYGTTPDFLFIEVRLEYRGSPGNQAEDLLTADHIAASISLIAGP